MPTFKLIIAYDGTNFSGWQYQPDRRTAQGALQDTWRRITGEQRSVSAASRTDAGVHALGQTVGIDTETHLGADDLFRALNATLPKDIVVKAVDEVSPGFHATRDAQGKRYRYSIHNARTRPLFDRNYVWHVPQPLDAELMQRAGQHLVGTHDFATFQSAGSQRESTVRTITAIEVCRPAGYDGARVEIDVAGTGFLYNMVRIIAGSLVDVGAGRRDPQWLVDALAAGDRRAAGRTAPPEGLCLLEVYY